jgi:hypothetical protein
VTGVPSVNFQSLSLTVQVLLSSDSMDSATSLTTEPSALYAVSPENRFWSGSPPPTSLVAVGINGFCGSVP